MPKFPIAAACLALMFATSAAAIAQAARPVGTVVVSNMNDSSATVLDARTGRIWATLRTGEGPHEVAVSHDGLSALVSNYGVRGKPGNSITVIDLVNARVARTLDLGDYKRPHGMAFLPGDTIAAVTCETSSAILLVDIRSGRVTATLPSNGKGTHMFGLSAKGDRIVAGNIGDGTISVIGIGSAGPPQVIRVARQPEGIAISPDGATAWAGSNRDSVVLVVDLRAAQPIDTIRGFGLPYRMAISANGRTAVVTDPMKAQIRVFDASTRRERFTIQVPADSVLAAAEVPGSPSPEGVAVSPDGRWAFVTLQGRNRLATVDLETGKIVALAVIGNWSDGVGFTTRARTDR
jgi:DNA-binding beta-propeller fold protein YncE